MKIVIDDKIPYIRGEAERLGECVYVRGTEFTPEVVKEADMLIVRTRTRCDRALLEGSAVKYVVTATIGYDHIDREYLKERGIVWTNCAGCNAGGVAQYVYAVLLLAQMEGWLKKDMVVGIVGVGNVGEKVAQLLAEKGIKLLLNDPIKHPEVGGEWVTLEMLAQRADVVTVHTPLTKVGEHATWRLLDEAFFEGAKEKCPLVVNAARGGVVCEEALKRAMRKGWVRAAVVDTWEHEPMIDEELLEEAWLATPHIAGYSADGKCNATRMALEAAARMVGKDMRFDIDAPEWPIDKCYNPCVRPACEELRYYDPRLDSAVLKRFRGLFEELRGNYPLRREGGK